VQLLDQLKKVMVKLVSDKLEYLHPGVTVEQKYLFIHDQMNTFVSSVTRLHWCSSRGFVCKLDYFF
jgi:predicted metalloprotease